MARIAYRAKSLNNRARAAVRRGRVGGLGWPGGCADQDVRGAFTKADGVVEAAVGGLVVSERLGQLTAGDQGGGETAVASP